MKKNITRVLATIVAIMLCGSLAAQTKIRCTSDRHNNSLDPIGIGAAKSLAGRSIKPIPHLPKGGPKSASVTFSATPTAESAVLTFTKNADCYRYYVAVTDTGLLEKIADIYASYGVSVTMEELMSQYVSGGTLCNSDTTIVVGGLAPATSYSCYIWALASATDQTGVAITGNGFVTTVNGGTGTATISVTHTAQAKSVSHAITCGSETGYFKMAFFDSASVARDGWTADSLLVHAAGNRNYGPGTASLITDELRKGTTYYFVFLPYNHNRQLGTAIVDTARTTGVSPAVAITDIHTSLTSVHTASASFTTSPNAACTHGYDVWLFPIEILRIILNYANQGYCIYDLADAPLYSGTAVHDFNITDLEASTTYCIYVAAKGEDTIYDYSTTLVMPMGGDTGIANITIAITNITATTATVAVTPDDNSAYFYFLYGPSTVFERGGMTTAEAVVNYMDNAGTFNNFSQGFSESLTNLTTATEYTVWAIPFNKNHTMGNAACEKFTPHSVTGIGKADAVQVRVCPNPVSDVLAIADAANYDEAILFNSLGQPVQSQKIDGGKTTFDISALPRGIYILRLQGIRGATTRKIVAK